MLGWFNAKACSLLHFSISSAMRLFVSWNKPQRNRHGLKRKLSFFVCLFFNLNSFLGQLGCSALNIEQQQVEKMECWSSSFPRKCLLSAHQVPAVTDNRKSIAAKTEEAMDTHQWMHTCSPFEKAHGQLWQMSHQKHFHWFFNRCMWWISLQEMFKYKYFYPMRSGQSWRIKV